MRDMMPMGNAVNKLQEQPRIKPGTRADKLRIKAQNVRDSRERDLQIQKNREIRKAKEEIQKQLNAAAKRGEFMIGVDIPVMIRQDLLRQYELGGFLIEHLTNDTFRIRFDNK